MLVKTRAVRSAIRKHNLEEGQEKQGRPYSKLPSHDASHDGGVHGKDGDNERCDICHHRVLRCVSACGSLPAFRSFIVQNETGLIL